MKKLVLGILVLCLFLMAITYLGSSGQLKMRNKITTTSTQVNSEGTINLPQPKFEGEMSLEEAILKRRSKRDFQDKSLNLNQVSQILWAGQGITRKDLGFRAAPSAGALYPLDLYLVVGENGVENLESAVYHYLPDGHQLEKTLVGDLKEELMRVSLNQASVGKAAVSLVITGEYERTTGKYGERGVMYVHIEAGHAAQNIALQVVSLNLGVVTIGAFEEEKLQEVLNLPSSHRPLYILPIGYPEE